MVVDWKKVRGERLEMRLSPIGKHQRAVCEALLLPLSPLTSNLLPL